jgi:hypothetical protein
VRQLQVVVIIEARGSIGIFVIDFNFTVEKHHFLSAQRTDAALLPVQLLIL